MFLVAVRGHMLPGLVLRSLYEVTFDALRDIWRDEAGTSSGLTTTGREEKLAGILRDSEFALEHDKTSLVFDGANIAMVLLGADDSEMPELLELVFNVWVDKLLYAGSRCSRESHAKQLGRGGELTTIVWILAEHAGTFRIGQRGPDQKQQEPAPLPMYPIPMYPPMADSPPPDAGGGRKAASKDGGCAGGKAGGGKPLPRPPEPEVVVPLPSIDVEPPRRHRERSRRYATLYPVD